MKVSYSAMTRICDRDFYGRAYLKAVMRAYSSFPSGSASSRKIPVKLAGEAISYVWLTRSVDLVADGESTWVEGFQPHISGPLLKRVQVLKARADQLERMEARMGFACNLVLALALVSCLCALVVYGPAQRSHSVNPAREIPAQTR
jgi:ubiquinone biosynthesis protein COQ9